MVQTFLGHDCLRRRRAGKKHFSVSGRLPAAKRSPEHVTRHMLVGVASREGWSLVTGFVSHIAQNQGVQGANDSVGSNYRPRQCQKGGLTRSPSRVCGSISPAERRYQ